jgi:hypothetical protein
MPLRPAEGFRKMHVRVDKARNNQAIASIDNEIGALAREILANSIDMASPYSDIAFSVHVVGRIKNSASSDQHSFVTHVQSPSLSALLLTPWQTTVIVILNGVSKCETQLMPGER